MSIVVVTGSRSLVDSPSRLLIKQAFVDTIRTLWPIEVHHGGATGPDSWASSAYEEIQKVHRPNPDKYPDLSPAERLFQRNIDMIDESRERATSVQPLIVVACWDGKSNGTAHAFSYAESVKVPVVYVPVGMISDLHRMTRMV